MKITLSICLAILLATTTGCRSVRLTPEGREVMVVNGLNALSTDCTRLGSVIGQHKLGYDHAITIVRNKAAQLYKADTVAVSTVEGWASPSRRVSAIAFNCSERRPQPIEIVNPQKPITLEQLDKAKKCQTKGGVWINDQCVIQVE
jgi:hypothetical protein